MRPPEPYRVGIFAIPGFALMSYASTVEPLRAANLLSGRTLYEIVHISNEVGSEIPSSGAAGLKAEHRWTNAPHLDLLLVIAGGDPTRFHDPEAERWLARFARRGTVIGGVSGGPVILARAGLLTHRRMTVHWEHAPYVEEHFGDLAIERRLYVIDRDRMTCGGGTAPIEMMHALIATHHGAEMARGVSDWFLHTAVRAPAAPQRAGLAERLGQRSPRLVAAIQAIEDHIADPLTLSQLALVAGVTPRQLNRLFHQAFGTSTMAYYRRARLDTAHRLLRLSTAPVAEIATATGFQSAAHFSTTFSKTFGTSPAGIARRES